jgi:hypothetical protein
VPHVLIAAAVVAVAVFDTVPSGAAKFSLLLLLLLFLTVLCSFYCGRFYCCCFRR